MNPSKKKWLYRLLAIGLGFFLLLALEGILRLLHIAPDEDFAPEQLMTIVENGQIKGEIVRSGAPYFLDQGDGMVETNPLYHRGKGGGFPQTGSMRKTRFSKESTSDRYFLLGGSAALGQQPVNLKIPQTWSTIPLGNSVYALPKAQSISGILEKNLRQNGKDVEILNAGMIAQDSGGVRRLVSEIIPYKPTGILLYMGNNEGIGMAYGVNGITLKNVPDVQFNLRKFRIYRVLRKTFAPEKFSDSTKLIGTKPEVLGRLTQNEWRKAGKAQISGNLSTDPVHHALMKRWITNISAIQELCDEHGIALYIITTPPHLLYPPFYSSNSPDLTDQGIRSYSSLLKQAQDFERVQSWQQMLTASQQALGIEQYHAQGWFVHAKALQNNKQLPNAFTSYERALMLDLSRKRTRLEYAQASIDFCSEHTCTSISAHEHMKEDVLKKGFSLYDQRFGDHEHLTPDGCAWIASIFASLILESSP
ncbi:MAG: hypothetical protein CL916_00075 [Deltaproteobacteria bacterium]|nr:hypothetical protein [Deltaproteobacteria bacterium]